MPAQSIQAEVYLLNRDPNENDLAEMDKWLGIYTFEVTRVSLVLNYWAINPPVLQRKIRPYQINVEIENEG